MYKYRKSRFSHNYSYVLKSLHVPAGARVRFRIREREDIWTQAKSTLPEEIKVAENFYVSKRMLGTPVFMDLYLQRLTYQITDQKSFKIHSMLRKNFAH